MCILGYGPDTFWPDTIYPADHQITRYCCRKKRFVSKLLITIQIGSVLMSVCQSKRLYLCPSKRLYLCPSKRLYLCPSKRLYLCPSERPSICNMIKLPDIQLDIWANPIAYWILGPMWPPCLPGKSKPCNPCLLATRDLSPLN